MKTILLISFLHLFSVLSFAQDANADQGGKFVGTWTYDSKRSTSENSDLYRNTALEITFAFQQMTIVKGQTMNKQTKTATIVLFTDNRGELNHPFPFNPGAEIKSNTTWIGETLVRIYVIPA